MPKKYIIKTLGCAMNISDSERISSFLKKYNFKVAENSNDADIIIFNTCGIRQAAENRAYSLINNVRKTNKISKIVLTGCLANRQDVIKKLKNKVDVFCEIKDFPNALKNIFDNIKNPYQKENIDYLSINPEHSNMYQAFVPIMTGCNNFCSYCVVPHARGREISRPIEEIMREIELLLQKNHKHIILLGQNVNSYSYKNYTFLKLLKKINSIPGKFWISFVSSHPKDMTNEVIETISKCKKICEWIHLPLQSGNDIILKKMNRKYTAKHYLNIISKIKKEFKKNKPNKFFSLSSDIIVGFPSETKKQFLNSAEIMEKVKFDMVYFGQFSPRSHTAAWKMEDNISSEEKTQRELFLNEILKKTSFFNNKKYIGKKIDVLIEKEKDGIYFGKTRTMKNIKIFSNKKHLIGKIIKVIVTKANTWNLEGKI